MKIIYHHRTRAEHAEGVHVREIIKSFRSEGHDVFVLAPPGVDTFKHETEDYIEKKSNFWGIVSRYFPQIGFEFLEICYNLFVFVKMEFLLRKKQIGFIYERYSFFTWAGCYLAKSKGVPFVLEVNEISGLKRTRGQILVGLAGFIEKKVFFKADAIIVVSRFLKDRIVSMGVIADKIHVLPNGVDIGRFNSLVSVSVETKKIVGLSHRIVLGFVGNFVKWHNFDFLLECFKEINSSGDCLLLLVGNGPARGEIESAVKTHSLEEHVRITGSVKHSLVPEFVQLMDICIIPHSNEYRSPIKMFEYMAMAKAVIAPSVGPILDIITDQKNGVLFKPNDKSDFKRCLLDLITDQKKRYAVSSAAELDIKNHYLWRHNAIKVFSIVSEIKQSKMIKG